MNTFSTRSLPGQRAMSTANTPPKYGTGQLPGRPETDPVITKTFLPRRDILLGIVPSTNISGGVTGHPCTLHQRSSSESVNGGSDRSHESFVMPTQATRLERERSEPGRLEGLTRQQLAWLEQQEIKPGHFTEAYIRNLSLPSRPLFSMRKMEVRERKSRTRTLSSIKERDRKGNSERRKNGSSTDSSRMLSQHSSNRQDSTESVRGSQGVEQAGMQYLPDGSPIINIPHGIVGDGSVQLDNQSELEKLKNELQSQSKGHNDQDSGKSSKRKSGSKSGNTAFAKSPSRKPAGAKSKAKKPLPGNSLQVKGQQTKPLRARVGTKAKRKKTGSKKLAETGEETEVGEGATENGEDSMKNYHLLLPPPSELAEERLKPAETVVERETGEGLSGVDGAPAGRDTAGSTLRVSDTQRRAESSFTSKQQARADERRLEVERRREEKRRLQLEQQKEEEERIRLLAEVERAGEEAARFMNTNDNYEDLEAPSSNLDLDALEEARRKELERLEALQEAQSAEENISRLTEEELERLMKEKEMSRKAERLRLEETRLRQEDERFRKEEERIQRLKRKQEAEEHRKQEEALKAQEEMIRWKQGLESMKRESTIKESVARLQEEIERAKIDAQTVKRFEGTVLSEPTYFSYFRYCPKLFEGPPKPKPKNEREKRGKRPQSTLAK